MRRPERFSLARVLATCSVVFLLTSSAASISASGGAGATTAQGPADWIGPDGNYPFNWDYSPQSSINLTNVGSLGLDWLFPLPSPSFPSPLGTSVIITPVIAHGAVYSITSSDVLIAESADKGTLLWTKNLALNYDYPGKGVLPESANLMGHTHAIWYTTDVKDQPLIWVAGDNYTVFAFNAASGASVLKLDYLPVDVPGNYGFYDPGGKQMVVDGQRGILITTTSNSEGTDAGRGFYEGWNITATPPKLLWRTFLLPPQDGADPLWSIKSVQNASYAWTFDGKTQVDLKALSNSSLYSMLYGDWGSFGFNGTLSFAGTGGAWGGSEAYDPQTGMVYVSTAQPAPDWNASTRPGLNLWSSSVLALDERTGRMVWGFQTSPHDLSDWDCSWSVMLANATVGGQSQKVVMKGCKNGYFYALDASTGKMLWGFDAPSIKRTATGGILNPANETDMVKPWANYPSTQPYLENPCESGGIESNPAYDPTTNMAFVATYNCPTWTSILPTQGKGVPYGSFGKDLAFAGPSMAWNATIWALNVGTGRPVWHYDISNVGYRGGVDVSAGMVFVPAADGYLRALDEQTGQVAMQRYIGGPICTQPAIGQDAGGDEELVFPVCSSHETRSSLPTNNGVMMALALTQATTVTVTSAVTPASVAPPGVPFSLFLAVTVVAVVFIVATGLLAVPRRRR